MTVVSDVAAIRARGDLTEDEKRSQIYTVKTVALLDVINNGKPAPGPIPALLGRIFTPTIGGYTIRINTARMTAEASLELSVTFNANTAQAVTHFITIVNPPVIPRSVTGNEKQDLITAAAEMLEGFV